MKKELAPPTSIQTGETTALLPSGAHDGGGGGAPLYRSTPKRTVLIATAMCAVLAAIVVIAVLANPRDGHRRSPWANVDSLINGAIAGGVTPGAALIVGALPGTAGTDSNGFFYAKAYGSFTYGAPTPVGNNNPAMSLSESRFDLASLTKVLASTTAIAQFYQRGEVSLDLPLTDPSMFGPGFAVNDKGAITIRNLLLHTAGFFPDPVPEYWNASFGCAESQLYYPQLNFSCQALIYESYLTQSLMYPTGTEFLYSDLSFIGMMWVVGKLAISTGRVVPADYLPGCAIEGPGAPSTAQCAYEAYVRLYVLGASEVNMPNSGFLPAEVNWALSPPTWNDSYYVHEVLQGRVSDENAYALGGISGHAGLFATAMDVASLAGALLSAPANSPFFNASTQATFATVGNVSLSNRALGWALNLPEWWGLDTSTYCQAFSNNTLMHTGYTGTEVCIDLNARVFAVFLTNRCYPVKLNFEILALRQSLSYEVVAALGLPANGVAPPAPVWGSVATE